MNAYPRKLKMKGLPFSLCGWNTTFEKTEEQFCDSPVYKSKSYMMYGIIPITAAKIIKMPGSWMLYRYDDHLLANPYTFKIEDTELPTGKWSLGYVTDCISLCC
jgi:hypothetical protein